MKHLDIQSTSNPCDWQERVGLVGLLSPHLAQSSMSTGTPTCPRQSCWRARTESVLPPNMGWNSRLWTKIAATCFTPDMDFDVASISLGVSDEDSCPLQADSSSREPCSGKNVSFKPERVLESSVRFSIWLGAQLPFAFTSSQWWHRSHALGDKVPTVRRCRRQPWWWSSACWD